MRLTRFLIIASIFCVDLPPTTAVAIGQPKPRSSTIIFDLGGVLLGVDNKACARELGITNFISYKLRGGSPSTIKTAFFDALNRLPSPIATNGARTPDGRPMPGIMCAWLMGAVPSRDLCQHVCKEIADHPEWFSSAVEQLLVGKTARMTFDPVRFARTMKPVGGAVEFVRACKARGYRVAVLSNWDPESFRLIARKYHNLFCLFDDITVSGDVGCMKPSPEIFELATQHVPAASCIFIDDQKENLAAARARGMKTIWCKPRSALIGSKPNLPGVHKKLVRMEQEQQTTEQLPAPVYRLVQEPGTHEAQDATTGSHA